MNDRETLTVQGALSLLQEILDSDHFSLPSKLKRFQDIVWDDRVVEASAEQIIILRQLAHDVDYFEAKPAVRREEPSYFGRDRLQKKISTALNELKALK